LKDTYGNLSPLNNVDVSLRNQISVFLTGGLWTTSNPLLLVASGDAFSI